MLVILTWKRKDYASPIPPSRDLDMLKELFPYKKLKTCFQNVVEKALSITFSMRTTIIFFLSTAVPITVSSPISGQRKTSLDSMISFFLSLLFLTFSIHLRRDLEMKL